MKNIKWGFIGCGRVVQQKSGRAFNEIPQSRIHAIMRRNIDAAKQSAIFFEAPQWYDKVSDLLSSEVDAIYIATPPGLHYEQAMACREAEKPVYIEKPFARNYSEAKAITDAFGSKNLPLFIGHYRRALPRFRYIKELIDTGTLGQVTSVQSYLNRIFSMREAKETWLYNPELSGGGKFYDIAAHTIDIICYLFGNIVEVNGFATNSGTDCPLEDTVVFSYRTNKGVIGSANFNCISDRKDDRMFISGTKGRLEFSIHGKDDIIVSNYETKSKSSVIIPDPQIVEQPMIHAVVDALLGKADFPCSGTDALPTYWAIDQILEQFYCGRQRQFWK